MIFLTGAGGYRVDTGRAGQTAVIARQRSGDVGWDHHPGVPRIRRDKKGRQPAEMRIGYSVATGLGSGAQLGNGNGQRIQRQRRWRTVTVAPGITISLSSSTRNSGLSVTELSSMVIICRQWASWSRTAPWIWGYSVN